jgi:enterochelin esterase-like enzyme
MVTTSLQRRSDHPNARRRVAGIITTALVLAASLITVRPAAADTPWLDVSEEGFARFSIPVDYVDEHVGEVSQVVAEGNFGPSSNWAELGLSRSGNAWTGIIGPLQPGSYHYQITADDFETFKDPTNPTGVESQPGWSTFFVPGDSARLLDDVPEGQGGSIETLTYRSTVEKEERSATVWLPPDYDSQRREPYPVLYLQHGDGQHHRDWIDAGRAKQILDNLTLDGDIEPMVVVMGNGDVRDFQKELFGNIMRAARHNYNIASNPARQAIAGLSNGGQQALTTLFENPGRFAYVGSFSGSADASDVNAHLVNRRTELLRLYTGNVTDPAYNDTYHLMNELDRAGVEYQFDGVNPDAGHNWNAWQENLIDFTQRLFRDVSDDGPSPGHLPLDGEFTLPAPGTTPTPWFTEDADGNTFVTFETTTDFSDAEHVTVWGNWAPGGSWTRLPLSLDGDRWRATVGPLEPWFWHYRLIVDRQAVKDTSNPTSITSEPTWSTFLIPGEPARLLTDVPDGQGGELHTMTYHSEVAGEERTSYVWTPPGYDPDRDEPYPVFFLQHGGGQSYTDWVEMGRAKQILDNHVLDGNLEPMVVVMSNGNVPDFTSELLENIVPATEEQYHVAEDPAQRALAGLSMGGGHTYGVLKSHPGEFTYIGVFSAGFGSTDGVDAVAINDGTTLLKVYVGDQTDFVYPSFMNSLETMDQLGIVYEFDGPTPGPHGWDVWQKNLIDFAPLLFT